jgi:hypothetical protein
MLKGPKPTSISKPAMSNGQQTADKLILFREKAMNRIRNKARLNTDSIRRSYGMRID